MQEEGWGGDKEQDGEVETENEYDTKKVRRCPPGQ